MADLCKEALKKLADVEDFKALIQDAKDEAGKENPWSRKDVFVNDEYGEKLGYPKMFREFIEYKGWKIKKHKTPLGHYVLIDSDSIVYAKYLGPNWRGKNLQLFLELLIKLADKNPDKYNPTKSTMIIYQLVTNKKLPIEKGCERLTLSEARRQFSHSKDLESEFFTIHPKDKKALVPLENFFTQIAIDQQNECVVLLNKMGARSVHITTFDEKKDKKGGEIKAGSKKINFHAGMSIDNELQKFSDLKVSFKGNSSGFSSNILEKSVWFKDDRDMKIIRDTLLSKNSLIDYELTTEVNENFGFDFKAAAHVLGVVKADLKAEFKKAKKQKRYFHVIFGE